jgi:serine phosphatase RsbU (regulator of sigma subunit)
MPSGMFDSVRYALQTVQLHPGDAFLFFTDGLIEARNAQEEEFGIEQLQEICAQNHTAAAEALVARISAAVDRFVGGTPQYDDMALAVLKLDHDGR